MQELNHNDLHPASADGNTKAFPTRSIHNHWFEDRQSFIGDVCDCYDWPSIEDAEGYEEGELEGEEDQHEIVTNMCCEAANGDFVDAIGVGTEGAVGTIGFYCKPCDSEDRIETLNSLGHWAHEMDHLTAHWFIFAILPTPTGIVGIDLIRYGMASQLNKENIRQVSSKWWEFDPMQLLDSDKKEQLLFQNESAYQSIMSATFKG